MNCDTAKTQFVDLLYEELDKASSQNLQAHIASCDACSAEFGTLTGARRHLGTIPQEEPGERILFTTAPRRSFAAWWCDFRTLLPQPAWARLSLGIAALALFLLAGASVSNFRLQYNEQGFAVSMSLLPKQQSQISAEAMETILARARQENIQYTARLIAAEREKQKQEWSETFTNFALEMDRKQDTQLNLIGNQLERWNESTNQQFRQLIQSVSYPRR